MFNRRTWVQFWSNTRPSERWQWSCWMIYSRGSSPITQVKHLHFPGCFMKQMNDDIKPLSVSRHTDKQLSRVCANWVNCCSAEGKNKPISLLCTSFIIRATSMKPRFYPRVYRLHVDLEVQLIFKWLDVMCISLRNPKEK